MRNLMFGLIGSLLWCSSCTEALDTEPELSPSIPVFLHRQFQLQRITHAAVVPAKIQQLFQHKAEAQFPVFAAEADFQHLIHLRFRCFDLYLSPLDEPGDFLALLYAEAHSARLLFVEWGTQNNRYYQQTLAPNGEGLRYFEGMGFEGEEHRADYTFVGPLYPCCYAVAEPALNWMDRFKKDWADHLNSDPQALAREVQAIPIGGILSLYAYGAIYLL